jgi:hypothetical protein
VSNLRKLLERRLQSWRDEKVTNKNGMAHFADRATRLIEADLAQGIEAGTAETTEIGSVHESPVRDSECAHNQGESD